MKKIVSHEEHCIKCKLCEVACTVEHSNSKYVWQAYDEVPRAGKGIEVHHELAGDTFALACRHCTHADCMKACFAAAMTRDADGVVHVNKEKCVGCWSCVMVCSYGAVSPGIGHKVAMKCDMCRGSELGPACVRVCPNEALAVAEI